MTDDRREKMGVGACTPGVHFKRVVGGVCKLYTLSRVRSKQRSNGDAAPFK
jgi:hypothetical protein